MTETQKPYLMINDFVTGKQIPQVGAEDNRQAVERYLVEKKGYDKKDIEVDVEIETVAGGETYRSHVGLVVSVDGTRFMAIKSAAGALNSWEREILTAARLLDEYQIPFAVVSDGNSAVVLDTITGKPIGNGLDAMFSKDDARQKLKEITLVPLPEKRRERESLIFRSYDSMNVNVGKNIHSE